MTKFEKNISICVITIITLGALGPAVLVREFWPFSNYKLYAELKKDMSLQLLSFYGVHGDNEIYLGGKEKYFYPLFNYHMHNNLSYSLKEVDGIYKVKKKLFSLLNWYEFRRLQGYHDGPKLDGLRLYKVKWSNDIEFKNIFSPEKIKLIAEVRSDI